MEFILLINSDDLGKPTFQVEIDKAIIITEILKKPISNAVAVATVNGCVWNAVKKNMNRTKEDIINKGLLK